MPVYTTWPAAAARTSSPSCPLTVETLSAVRTRRERGRAARNGPLPLHRRADWRACRRGLPCRRSWSSASRCAATRAMDTTSAPGPAESHNRDGCRSSARCPANRVCGARRSHRGCRRALRYRSASAQAPTRNPTTTATIRSGPQISEQSKQTSRHYPPPHHVVPFSNGTKLTCPSISLCNSSPRRVSRSSCWRPSGPTGAISRPPGASCWNSTSGIASGAAAIRMPSYGPCAGQP